MCIAIPPPLRKNRSVAHGGWSWLSARPIRLLGLAALLQALLLGYPVCIGGPPPFLLILLPLGTLALGVAMQTMPPRLHSLPVSYPKRVLVFLAVVSGGSLIAAGLSSLGSALLAGGWVLAWRDLRWKLRWATGPVPTALRLGFHGLELLALLLFSAMAWHLTG